MATRVGVNAPLSNPFGHNKRQNVFNTPFGASGQTLNSGSTVPDNQWTDHSNGYYRNGGPAQDEGGDDFNFVADPVPHH
jgi:hypothetical protein